MTVTKPAPFFSIITVNLNNKDGLLATQDSLAQQLFRDFEWIVIDGASDDSSQAALDQDSVTKFISEPDRGLYDAMNKGIEIAAADYVIFLNAGDRLYEPATLRAINEEITAHGGPVDFAYGHSYEHDRNLYYKSARAPGTGWRGMFTHHQAMIYKRESIGMLRYNEVYRIAADYEFTMKFLRQAPHRLYLPFPVCIFEAGGLAQQNAAKARREEFVIRKELGLCHPVLYHLLYLKQALCRLMRRTAPALYWRLRP